MSIITLVSGGLDSTLMSLLTQEERIMQYPLFIDYGQTCLFNFCRYKLPVPKVVQLSGYGSLLSSGLTDSSKRIYEDAFLPCRNLMFITVGAAYAHQCGSNAVAIGLLDEAYSLFPDQSKTFVIDAEALVSKSLGHKIRILTPLMSFSKAEVVRIAKEKGINGTYSCHAGTDIPCGMCVACREYNGLEV
jgi:7-cyano-7-deazaguanine synthase